MQLETTTTETIPIKVRFAPSPTGYLHLGNARMACLNYFLAKSLRGEYILRIDDTDFKRVKPEYIQSVKDDLNWLGITWHEEFKQSDRIDIYNQFCDKLKADGRLYPCYETTEELEYKKKLQLAKGKPPIYDRSMLRLSIKEKESYEKEGRKPYYRLKIKYEDIKWHDIIKGEIHFKGEHISDPVVVRDDGSYLYILTSVLDDIEKKITHVLRGEDHVVNTAVQIQMFKYLDATIPKFAHLPLITNNNGMGFSKREGSLSLQNLREEGILPIAIHNYLYSLGLGEQNIFYNSTEEISKVFNLSKYNDSSAKFDEQKLLRFNLQALQTLNLEEINILSKKYLNLKLESFFWEVIKHNITKFQDLTIWHDICYNSLINTITIANTTIANTNTLSVMLETLPQGNWNETTWDSWIALIKEKTPLRGKALFHDIRMTLSGLERGPEFKNLILLIGKKEVEQRLKRVIK